MTDFFWILARCCGCCSGTRLAWLPSHQAHAHHPGAWNAAYSCTWQNLAKMTNFFLVLAMCCGWPGMLSCGCKHTHTHRQATKNQCTNLVHVFFVHDARGGPARKCPTLCHPLSREAWNAVLWLQAHKYQQTNSKQHVHKLCKLFWDHDAREGYARNRLPCANISPGRPGMRYVWCKSHGH